MRKKKVLTEEQMEELKELSETKSCVQLEKHFGISRSTIAIIMDENNIERKFKNRTINTPEEKDSELFNIDEFKGEKLFI